MNMTSQAKLSLCFLNNLQGLTTEKKRRKKKKLKSACLLHEMLSAQTKYLDNDFFLNHFSLYTIKMD